MAAETSTAAGSLPAEIAGWLGRTLLLYGVPFHYLVPDERMLPPESIRFFYLDPAWLKCLLEGALSVGRTSTTEEELDQRLSNSFLDQAPAEAAALRRAARDPEGAKTIILRWPLSGFLLRSQVVEGWQGLEMTASGVDGDGNPLDPLVPLRIDRLGPDVMLAIFNGKLTRLRVKQPPEGMHFGASPAGENAFRRLSLRCVTPRLDGKQVEVGDAVHKATDLPLRRVEPTAEQISAGVPLDRCRGAGVVEVRRLAGRLEQSLRQAGAMAREGAAAERLPDDPVPDEHFTSAELALQMVESPGKVIFTPAGRQGSEP